MVKDAPKNSKQHTIYKLKDGTRVPGVTTILSVLNKPALVPWANNLGLQGIKVREYVDDKAAIGTLAHQMIADHLRKVDTDTSDYTAKQIDQAENSVLSYLEWEKRKSIVPCLIEAPLVSETYLYGGTIDCLAWVNGVITLLDFKTGKAIYPEMFYQLAAYYTLASDYYEYDKEYGIAETKILRIGRDETEGFEVCTKKTLETEWEVFEHCLAIYQLQKEIKND